MRVLVTGGAGFIGAHLCARLLERGDEVSALDSFEPFHPERLKRRAVAPLLTRGLRLFEVDVRDAPGLTRSLEEARPEAVVHLAALTGVPPSLELPAEYADVNVRGTAVVLEACRRASVRRFVLGSSSSVYGHEAQLPFRETARIDRPSSPYAASKAAAELLARTFHDLYGGESVVLRLFSVYGPRQRPDLVIHRFARRMLAGQTIPFVGDGASRRDYTHVADIVCGILAALDRPLRWDVVNLGAGQSTSLDELVRLLEGALGVPARLDPRPAQQGDMQRTQADLGHAARVLGYAPVISLPEGLRGFAEWIRGEGRDWA